MRAPVRPRRSALYMPGSNVRALEKAKGIKADAFIFDLEDAVSPDAKAEARDNVCAAAASGGYGSREVLLRANGLGTPWYEDDLKALVMAVPDGIVIPKINSATDVKTVVRDLEALGVQEKTRVWAMIESPAAIFALNEIAAASDRLAGFIMGTNDLVKDMRARHTADRAPIMTALSLSLLAARAHGLAILDGVYQDIRDQEGFARQCQQSVEMGFDGRTVVHPDQVAVANAAFAPSDAEVDFSRRMIAAFEEAVAAGKFVAVLDGKMIENLHVENARRIVASHEAIQAMEAA